MPRLHFLAERPLHRALGGLTAGRVAIAALLALLPVGCGNHDHDSVQRYQIPKRELLYAANHVERQPAASERPTQVVQRMLAAIVPHGAQTWYFKMTGPAEPVASQEAAFRQLIESLRFDTEQSPPQWTLPAAWREEPGTGLRLATLKVDVSDQTLEVSVMPLATSLSGSSVLDNVNRWRQQMRLPAITHSELDQETTTVEMASGPATLVNLLGHYAGGALGSAAPRHGHARPAQVPARSEVGSTTEAEARSEADSEAGSEADSEAGSDTP